MYATILNSLVPGGMLLLFMACSSTPTPSARVISYGFELEECTRNAQTCAESIKCENEVRTRYSRPLRDAEKGCK